MSYTYREREMSRSRLKGQAVQEAEKKSNHRPSTAYPYPHSTQIPGPNVCSRSRPRKVNKVDSLDMHENYIKHDHMPDSQNLHQQQQFHNASMKKKTTMSQGGSRPKTCGETPKIVHFSGIVDRFRPGSPTSHVPLSEDNKAMAMALERKAKNQILRNNEEINHSHCQSLSTYNHQHQIDDQNNRQPPKRNLMSDNICINNQTPGVCSVRHVVNPNTNTALVPLRHRASNCDLEFINKEFKYDDDTMSVMEFQTADAAYLRQLRISEDESKAEGDSAESDERGGLTGLINSMLSFPSLHRVNLFTGAAKVGEIVQEKLLQAGQQVTNAIFSDPDVAEAEIITYNGYKIHTIGKNLCINSVILRGVKAQCFRIIVQTKDYQGIHKKSNNVSKAEPKILITDNKWTLLYGCYEEEGTGLLEIEVPPPKINTRIKNIKTEGPCHGLIFIDVPTLATSNT